MWDCCCSLAEMAIRETSRVQQVRTNIHLHVVFFWMIGYQSWPVCHDYACNMHICRACDGHCPYGELLLLIAIHLKEKQLDQIEELIADTLNMKVSVSDCLICYSCSSSFWRGHLKLLKFLLGKQWNLLAMDVPLESVMVNDVHVSLFQR